MLLQKKKLDNFIEIIIIIIIMIIIIIIIRIRILYCTTSIRSINSKLYQY